MCKRVFLFAAVVLCSFAFSPSHAIVQSCVPGSASQGCTSGSGTGGQSASCTVTLNCSNGSVSCTSNKNDCKRGNYYVECDGKKTWC